MTFDDEQTEVLEIVGKLMESNAKFTNNLTNSLMESYERSAVRAETALRLAQRNVVNLFGGPYAPSEHSVMIALFPDDNLVDTLTDNIMAKRQEQRGW